MLLLLATTKFCCVTMFEVGGNTCNNALQLATQHCCVEVEEKCSCPYITGPLTRLAARLYNVLGRTFHELTDNAILSLKQTLWIVAESVNHP